MVSVEAFQKAQKHDRLNKSTRGQAEESIQPPTQDEPVTGMLHGFPAKTYAARGVSEVSCENEATGPSHHIMNCDTVGDNNAMNDPNASSRLQFSA